MSSLYNLGSIFVKWGLNVWIVESLTIYLETIHVLVAGTSDEALLSLFFILIAFVIGAEVFG